MARTHATKRGETGVCRNRRGTRVSIEAAGDPSRSSITVDSSSRNQAAAVVGPPAQSAEGITTMADDGPVLNLDDPPAAPVVGGGSEETKGRLCPSTHFFVNSSVHW